MSERWAYKLGDSAVGLCETAYCMITGCALSTFQNWKRMVRAEEQPVVKGRKPGQRSAKTEAARAFIVHYASAHDYSPNETCKKNGLTVVSEWQVGTVVSSSWPYENLLMAGAAGCHQEAGCILHVWHLHDTGWLLISGRDPVISKLRQVMGAGVSSPEAAKEEDGVVQVFGL